MMVRKSAFAKNDKTAALEFKILATCNDRSGGETATDINGDRKDGFVNDERESRSWGINEWTQSTPNSQQFDGRPLRSQKVLINVKNV